MKAKNSVHSSPTQGAKGKPDRLTARAKKPDVRDEVRGRRNRSAQPNEADVSALVWDQFRKDKQLRLSHNVSKAEMKMLSWAVVFGCDLGRICSLRDLIYTLNTIRHAVRR